MTPLIEFEKTDFPRIYLYDDHMDIVAISNRLLKFNYSEIDKIHLKFEYDNFYFRTHPMRKDMLNLQKRKEKVLLIVNTKKGGEYDYEINEYEDGEFRELIHFIRKKIANTDLNSINDSDQFSAFSLTNEENVPYTFNLTRNGTLLPLRRNLKTFLHSSFQCKGITINIHYSLGYSNICVIHFQLNEIAKNKSFHISKTTFIQRLFFLRRGSLRIKSKSNELLSFFNTCPALDTIEEIVQNSDFSPDINARQKRNSLDISTTYNLNISNRSEALTSIIFFYHALINFLADENFQ